MSKFPESVQCKICKSYFMPCEGKCSCGQINNVSSIISKIRPVLLWIGQNSWYNSMAFAIPLSSSKIIENQYNQPIYLEHYSFLHKNAIYHRPMRAIVHQSTRIDGCALKQERIIGKLTDQLIQSKIESKLFNWIFEAT
ncbi:hypothetical protein ACFL2L_01270 [Patescibacteria group bacterium]